MNAAMALGIPRGRVVECTSACGSIAFAKTIQALTRWTFDNFPDVRLEKLRRPDGAAIRSFSLSVRGVLELPPGVYLVRLMGLNDHNGEVDHAIAVDTITQWIFDSFDANAMALSLESLSCCVGDGFDLCDIKEIRRVSRTQRAKRTSDGRRERNRKRKRAKRAAQRTSQN